MTASAVHAIREQLKEARRYSETDPVTCAQMIGEACEGFAVFRGKHYARWVARWSENLQVAVDALLVDPDVAKSYLYSTVHELGQLHSELRNREDSDGIQSAQS